jgi:hypothetical protein
MRVFIIGSSTSKQLDNSFESFCKILGEFFAAKNIDLILCSPFADSADSYIVEGVKSALFKNSSIQLYYPNTDAINKEWDGKLGSLKDFVKITRFRQEAPLLNEPFAIKYSWLYCQIQAITTCDFVFVIGGKIEGSSNMLVRIADAQGKNIIPIPKFGGVGELFFEKKKYQLMDAWGLNYVEELSGSLKPEIVIDTLITQPKDKKVIQIRENNSDDLTFFISYSREGPAKADFVETILRRRNYNVIRDDNDIAPSQDIPNAIKESILRSDIFIALWFKEYACSPWCYDELSIALDSHTLNGKSLWIFRLDKTRLVPPKARKLLWYDVETREEIEGKILSLLEK